MAKCRGRKRHCRGNAQQKKARSEVVCVCVCVVCVVCVLCVCVVCVCSVCV